MDIINNILGSFGFFKNSDRSFFSNRLQRIGNAGATYIDVTVPYRLYNEIPELNQVINKKADMFSNGRFKLVNIKDGKTIEDLKLFALLENPNVLQSQNKWLKNYITQLDVYGNQFIYKNSASKLSYPASLTNVSPACITPILTGKSFEQVHLSDIIKEYEYKEGNSKRIFLVEDIIWSKIDDLDNPVIGCSPLKSLRFPLSNTKLAYDYLNIISGEKGAIGMIGSTNKDGFGSVPMNPEDKIALENQFTSNYGVGDDKKSRIAFTGGNTTWIPMTYPTRDLLLMEQIDANKLTICDHFGLNINIFSSKNQTYENVKNALIQSYSDAIIPAADAFCQTLTKALNIDKRFKLTLDYSHIAILQADRKMQAETLATQLNSVQQAVASGIITIQQANNIYTNSFGLVL